MAGSLDPTTIPDQLDTISQQFAAGNARMKRLEEGQVSLDRRIKRMEDQLSENTEMTRDLSKGQHENAELLKDIKDAVTAGRVMGKLGKWVGGMAAAGVSVWGAVEIFIKHK